VGLKESVHESGVDIVGGEPGTHGVTDGLAALGECRLDDEGRGLMRRFL
jgi:hypothetical protein